MEYDLILVNGAPGVGKTTLSALLGEHYRSPVVDFGLLREFHLDRKWERRSEQEEEMTFTILQQMLTTYIDHRLKNIFVNDLQEWRIDSLRQQFSNTNSLVLSLVVSEYAVLKERIETRDRGWRDVDAAWARNEATRSRAPWPNELRVDVSVVGIDNALRYVTEALTAHNQ